MKCGRIYVVQMCPAPQNLIIIANITPHCVEFWLFRNRILFAKWQNSAAGCAWSRPWTLCLPQQETLSTKTRCVHSIYECPSKYDTQTRDIKRLVSSRYHRRRRAKPSDKWILFCLLIARTFQNTKVFIILYKSSVISEKINGAKCVREDVYGNQSATESAPKYVQFHGDTISCANPFRHGHRYHCCDAGHIRSIAFWSETSHQHARASSTPFPAWHESLSAAREPWTRHSIGHVQKNRTRPLVATCTWKRQYRRLSQWLGANEIGNGIGEIYGCERTTRLCIGKYWRTHFVHWIDAIGVIGQPTSEVDDVRLRLRHGQRSAICDSTVDYARRMFCLCWPRWDYYSIVETSFHRRRQRGAYISRNFTDRRHFERPKWVQCVRFGRRERFDANAPGRFYLRHCRAPTITSISDRQSFRISYRSISNSFQPWTREQYMRLSVTRARHTQ